MTPTEVGLAAAAAAFSATVGAITATYWVGLQRFRRKVVWEEGATRLDRVRTTATVGSRFVFDRWDWQRARHVLPRIALAAGLGTAGLALLGVGFNEVFLS